MERGGGEVAAVGSGLGVRIRGSVGGRSSPEGTLAGVTAALSTGGSGEGGDLLTGVTSGFRGGGHSASAGHASCGLLAEWRTGGGEGCAGITVGFDFDNTFDSCCWELCLGATTAFAFGDMVTFVLETFGIEIEFITFDEGDITGEEGEFALLADAAFGEGEIPFCEGEMAL